MCRGIPRISTTSNLLGTAAWWETGRIQVVVSIEQACNIIDLAGLGMTADAAAWDALFSPKEWGERRDELRSHAAREGLGPWELSIFEAIRYDSGNIRTLRNLEHTAFGRYLDSWPAEIRRHSSRCFGEGWIEHVDMPFLRARRHELDGVLMPRGLLGCEHSSDEELCGVISFTKAGAEFYLRFWQGSSRLEHWAAGACRDDPKATEVFGTSLAECENAISLIDDLIHHDSPVQIGRWCDRWWRQFETGIRVRCWFAHDETSP